MGFHKETPLSCQVPAAGGRANTTTRNSIVSPAARGGMCLQREPESLVTTKHEFGNQRVAANAVSHVATVTCDVVAISARKNSFKKGLGIPVRGPKTGVRPQFRRVAFSTISADNNLDNSPPRQLALGESESSNPIKRSRRVRSRSVILTGCCGVVSRPPHRKLGPWAGRETRPQRAIEVEAVGRVGRPAHNVCGP